MIRAGMYVCGIMLLFAAVPALAGEKGPPEERVKKLEREVVELRKRLRKLEAGAKKATVPLKDSAVSLQSLIDQAKDGDTVKVPRARYVSKKSVKIDGRKDLTLACEKGTQILCVDTSADVISITNSANIRISNALLRHKKPLTEYQCHGSVLRLKKSTGVTIVESELNGCGAIGLHAQESKGISVQKCLIRKNSWCAFYLRDCAGVKIRDNVIEDNGEGMNFYKVDALEMANNVMRRNRGYTGRVPVEPGPSKPAAR